MDSNLNVASKEGKQSLEKRKKKNKQKDTQDSGFSFTWDKSKNAQGKALKKKLNKQAKKATKQAKDISENDAGTPVNTSGVGTVDVDFEAVNKSKNIKRKQKKDKLLAKQLISEGRDVGVQKQNTDHSHKGYSLFSERHKDLYIDTQGGKSVSEDVFARSGKKFSDLNIHKHLVSNLEKIDFSTLTNVQEKSIPVILSGQNTLIRSQTGSGKTLAYAVPIIDALQSITPRLQRADGVQAIVVVPTRELALQTHELFGKINTFQRVVTGHLCGGENRKSEKDRIRKGINVLIGTPGRLLDHVLHTTALKLDKVRCLVLDEADRLLDMGFRKDIISLVEELDKAKTNSEYDPMVLLKQSNNSEESDVKQETRLEDNIPILRDMNSKERQTILLSATLSKAVSELADFTMKEHAYIDALEESADNVVDSDDFVIPSTVRQEFVITYVKHRLFTLSALIVEKSKQNSKVFVFMASAQMVEFHYDLFRNHLLQLPKNRGKLKRTVNNQGENVVVFDDSMDSSEDELEVVLDTEVFKLHGSMDQKERKEVFTNFRAAKKGVLLCTDVAARGLDVPEADCIVQYNPPQTDQDYLHRVGRTGRAGKSGSAIIFLTHEEQEYITHLKDHKVFLKERDAQEFLRHLCDLMDEPDFEQAATALQRHYESAVTNDKSLCKSACFAYSTWSRYYNSYPAKMRTIFDFKNVNLGHYVTSFALRITPTEVSRIVRGQVANVEQPRLNKKLSNFTDDGAANKQSEAKKRKSISLATSEFSSGLEPTKKRKKKNSQ